MNGDHGNVRTRDDRQLKMFMHNNLLGCIFKQNREMTLREIPFAITIGFNYEFISRQTGNYNENTEQHVFLYKFFRPDLRLRRHLSTKSQRLYRKNSVRRYPIIASTRYYSLFIRLANVPFGDSF